jgi:uncharacterized membrane protein
MTIGDISIIPFTLAITQGLKSVFGIEGKTNQIVAFVVATLLTILSLAISQGLLPEVVTMWLKIVVSSIGGGLSAIGLFDYVRSEITRKE